MSVFGGRGDARKAYTAQYTMAMEMMNLQKAREEALIRAERELSKQRDVMFKDVRKEKERLVKEFRDQMYDEQAWQGGNYAPGPPQRAPRAKHPPHAQPVYHQNPVQPVYYQKPVQNANHEPVQLEDVAVAAVAAFLHDGGGPSAPQKPAPKPPSAQGGGGPLDGVNRAGKQALDVARGGANLVGKQALNMAQGVKNFIRGGPAADAGQPAPPAAADAGQPPPAAANPATAPVPHSDDTLPSTADNEPDVGDVFVSESVDGKRQQSNLETYPMFNRLKKIKKELEDVKSDDGFAIGTGWKKIIVNLINAIQEFGKKYSDIDIVQCIENVSKNLDNSNDAVVFVFSNTEIQAELKEIRSRLGFDDIKVQMFKSKHKESYGSPFSVKNPGICRVSAIYLKEVYDWIIQCVTTGDGTCNIAGIPPEPVINSGTIIRLQKFYFDEPTVINGNKWIRKNNPGTFTFSSGS